MKRLPLPGLVVAVTLALLLPLEQAHCAWMGLQQRASSSASTASHACCEPGGNADVPAPEPPAGCSCLALPSVTLPAIAGMATDVPTAAVLLPAAPDDLLTSPTVASESVSALESGSPPLPPRARAYPPRAPPLFR